LFENCLQILEGKDSVKMKELLVMSTTLCILLDTRRIKKSMKYPVKLRVTFERVSEYYQSIFDLSKQEFEKLTAPRISIDLKFIRDQLKEIERTAQNAVNILDPFNFSDFEKDFIRNNNLFRQRKLKLEVLWQSSIEFDYTPS
jgi:hypothetical protein